MDRSKKGEYIGLLGTVIVHAAVIALLILMTITAPEPTKEELGGVPVMLGNVDMSQGFDDPSLVDVDLLPEEASAAEATPDVPSEQDLLTQTQEETVAVKPKPKKETVKPKEIKKVQKTEAEKAAEAERIAEEKAARERKAAEEAAKRRVAGAFGKGSQMGANRGSSSSGSGVEGSVNGNSSTGAKSGIGGYGTFDLGGRSIGHGGLPRPTYNVQEEGRVVVAITVNPSGTVVDATIHRQTNTVNSALRRSALEAARKARFNAVDGVNNQMGTITYYFNLR